ncbi:MAG TPA: inositol 2-dehydrogenase [Solirubrobacteraceae bacterium]
MEATRTSTLRVGVIGVGRIGRLHAELLARQVPGAAVSLVHDAREDAARAVAGALGVPSVADAEALMAADEVDAVAICTSTDTHADLIVAAARAGKAIFCEKPVSLELAEVDRALAAVDEAGVPFQIGFNRRFDPAHAAVAAAVADGTVGEPHLVRISSRDPAPPPMDYVRTSGGIFLDMTIHDFDMARFVTGSEVVEVFARGAVRVDPAFADAGDVDTAVATLIHDNGCLTVIDNSRQAVYGFDQRVEVFGSAGMAASENPLAHSAIARTAEGTRAATLPYFYLERYIPSYVREWRAFVGAVSEGRPPLVGGRDARAPLVIGLAAGRSLREGRPVRLAEVDA